MRLWGKQLTLTERLYVLELDTVSSKHCVTDGRLLAIAVTYTYIYSYARSDCLSEAPLLTSSGMCVMRPGLPVYHLHYMKNEERVVIIELWGLSYCIQEWRLANKSICKCQ